MNGKITLVSAVCAVAICTAVNASAASEAETAPTRGILTGSQVVTHPEWFIESFLDIPEDSAAAGSEGKHAILFFDSPGCPYCYKMIEENFKHSWYTDYIQNNFNTIAINIHGEGTCAPPEHKIYADDAVSGQQQQNSTSDRWLSIC